MKTLWWYHKNGYPEDFSFAVAEDHDELRKIISRERETQYSTNDFEREFEYGSIRMVGRYAINCEYTD